MKASLAICLLLIACAACSPATYSFHYGSHGTGGGSGSGSASVEGDDGSYGSTTISESDIDEILSASGDEDSKASDIEASLTNAVNNGGDIGSAAEGLFKIASKGGHGADVAIRALTGLAGSGNPSIYDALLRAARAILKAGFNLPNAVFEAFEHIPGFSQILDLFGGRNGVIGGTISTGLKGISDTGARATDSAYDLFHGRVADAAHGVGETAHDAIHTVADTGKTFLHGGRNGVSFSHHEAY